ncbi:MAG: helix-turn-helix transcriptional regulator [Lachnospiraceae bacterium]|nr:helix-turn-helix transcriptional regulator [Lachnospiraceae bacterium]
MLYCHIIRAQQQKEVGIIRNRNEKFNDLLLQNINQAIDEAGLSKQEVAKRLGVDYSTIWRILNGQRGIKPDFIAEIAHMTYRTPNDFFYAKD